MTDIVAAPAAAPVAPAAPASPVATPTPAPAPVHLDAPAGPVVTPPAADPVAAPDTPGPVTYAPTGDAGLDVALGFVGKLGISMEDPAMQATASGDFSLIKAKLATMGAAAAGWEQMVALAEQANDRAVAAETESLTAISDAVHECARGAEQWGVVNAWASANATAEEKAAVNAMFDAGPVQARAAALMLIGLHAKAAGTVVNPAPATRDAPANQGQGQAPLNRRDFAKAVDQLARKIGPQNMNNSPEYAALIARRQAYSN